MNGRRLLVFSSLLVAFSVAAPGVAAGKRGGTDRPAKGSTSGTSAIDAATGAGTSQGTGTFSHLGKSTYTLSFTSTVTGPTTIAVSGTGTVVAPNGDQVFATFTGTGTSPSLVPVVGQILDSTVVFTITGGTGRFSDATGTLTATGPLVTDSVVGTNFTTRDTSTLRGRVSY